MASQYIACHKDQAEIYHGESICKKKSRELLGEFSLPEDLLPLDNIEEVAHNRVIGFVWLKQRQKKNHRFNCIKRVVSYEPKVTTFMEEHRMRRLTEVKTKELFIWITIVDISIDNDNSSKITFANPSGLSKTFSVSTFAMRRMKRKKERSRKVLE